MSNSTVDDFIAGLDRKVGRVIKDVERTEAHRIIVDPSTATPIVLETVRQILRDVGSYGPHITEASFTAIGRLHGHEVFMGPLIGQLLEEVFHPGMAAKESITPGGAERPVHRRTITPTALAVGAVCRFLGERESPFCFLGYMYLLEATTANLAERYRGALQAKGEEIGFVTLHAREDEAHTRQLRVLISKIVGEVPEAAPEIEYGFDCLATVYPEPIWNAAFRRAVDEPGRS